MIVVEYDRRRHRSFGTSIRRDHGETGAFSDADVLEQARRIEEEQERFPEVAEETMELRRYDEGRAHDVERKVLDEQRAEDQARPRHRR